MEHTIESEMAHSQKYEAEDMAMVRSARETPFTQFWKTVNDILKSRGQAEMQFGEARDWWAQHQGRF